METLSTQNVQLANWTSKMRQVSTQTMINIATQPDIISLSLGMPATEFFPTDGYTKAADYVLANNPHALQYGPPLPALKQHIVSLMARRGVSCREEQIFLTAGVQQATSFLTRLLLDKQSSVIVEELTYDGFFQAIEPIQPRILTVPTNSQTGIDVDAVEALLSTQARPAFIYTISDGHNPLGISMSLEKRQHLTELARHYRVPILEDDAYGFLHYSESSLPPLKAFEPDWVFYMGTFSKILVPGLRVGWTIVPEYMIPFLTRIKEGSDINTATFAQRTIAAYMEMGGLDKHIDKLRLEYGLRRDTMMAALEKYFPSDARWYQPSHGLFVWIELPGEVDVENLLKRAIEQEKVAFMPGFVFEADELRHRSASCIRLTFANSSPEKINDGVARLARVL